MKVRAVRLTLLLSVLLAATACSRGTAVPAVDTAGDEPASAPGAADVLAPAPESSGGAPVTESSALTGTVGVTETAGAVGVTGTTAVTRTARTTATIGDGAGAPENAEPIEAITRTLTFADPAAFYAFDYPASWTLSPYAGAVAMLTSFPLEEPGHGGIAPGETKMDFTPDLELTRTDLEQMAAQTRAQTTVIAEADLTLSGSIPAKRMTLRGPAGDEMALLLTIIDGRGLRVLGYGDLAWFDPIVRTIRPTE